MAGETQQQATSSTDSTAAAPPPGMPALPSLNPADSPYQPLTLPEVRTPTQHQLPEQEPVQNLGAVNKAGAFAYMANQVIRGAVQGYDDSRLQHAQQVNKKLQALGTLEQQLGQQYQRAYNEVGSSKPGMTPEQILDDPTVKQLHNQLLSVHQATLDAIGKYLPQLQESGAGGSKGKGKGKGQGQGNLLQQLSGEPDEQLRAYAEAAQKLGPTAFYQVASPQQLQAMYQQRQTAGIGGQTAATTADTQAAVAQINNKLAHAVASGAPQDQINALIKQRDELLPQPKFPVGGETRTGKGSDGVWYEWKVDQEGNEISDTRRPLSTAGLNSSAPKVGSLGEFTIALFGPRPTPKQELEAKRLWTPEVQTVGTHTVMVWNGLQEVPVQVETTSTRGAGGSVAAVPNVRADQEGQSAGVMPAAAPAAPTTTTTIPAASKPLNPYRNPEDQPADVSYTFNKSWAKPGPYVTKLSPTDEAEFRKWAAANLSQNELRNLDNPQTDYDTRGWWLAGKHGDPDAKLVRSAWDGKMHGNDKWKTPYNGTFSNESIYATPDAPHWEGEGKLVAKDGRLVADETPAAKSAKKAQPATAPHAAAPTPRSNAGVISTGTPVGQKLSPAVAKAQGELNDALAVVSVGKDAIARPNGSTQYTLLTTLLHSSIGRVNMVEITNMMKSAGLGAEIEGWYTKAKNGQLPPALVQQLRDTAMTWARGKAAALDAAIKEQGVIGGQGSAQNIVNPPSGGVASPSSMTDDEFLMQIPKK